MVETLRLLLRPHPIRWDRPDGRYIAVGDETRFRQVLEQLLENESKYAPTEEGVSIGVWRYGDEVQVYVTDDGPGVPVEDWESVFEPFVRIERPGEVAGLRDRAVRGAAAHDRDGRPHLPGAERVRRLALRGGAAGGLDVGSSSRSTLRDGVRYRLSPRHGSRTVQRRAMRQSRGVDDRAGMTRPGVSPFLAILRDIARGGIAGCSSGSCVGRHRRTDRHATRRDPP